MWATQRELLQDSNVLGMIKDITEDRNLGFWASQEPLEIMPNVDSDAGLKFMKYAKIFALIRNVLVFLPVAVTWKAVAEATTGFAEFVSVNSATPVNFLEFWQNGMLIQDAMPNISPDHREFILTGVVKGEWDDIMAKDNE